MAEITAGLVKQLRETTGAGMMDCKKALTECGGNLEEAQDWLRKKGISTAAKKAGRAASDGLVGVSVDGNCGALVEVNSETDFVARNEKFQTFVSQVSQLALAAEGELEKLNASDYPETGRNVADELTQLIATISENMNLRRSAAICVSQGVVASYVHNQAAPGLGKIGVLVGLESAGDTAALATLGKQLAMHVAASNPQSIDRDDLDPAAIEREKNVLAEQARASGKPEEIIEKMVVGRLNKFYEEVCLLDQTFVIDQENKVRKVLEQAGKDLGSPVKGGRYGALPTGRGRSRGRGRITLFYPVFCAGEFMYSAGVRRSSRSSRGPASRRQRGPSGRKATRPWGEIRSTAAPC